MLRCALRYLLLIASLGLGAWTHGNSSSGDHVVTPLHLFFISPTGSDALDGTTPAKAWLTPNHPIVCGDIILAQGSGSYDFNNFVDTFGTNSNCPSTTGGIDGAGGIYFSALLCAGSSVGSCQIIQPVCNNVNSNQGMRIQTDNWAIEGWGISMGYDASISCDGWGISINTSNNTGIRHHFAMINNIVWKNAVGITQNNNNANGGAGFGEDYWAIVGNAVQDSAGRCSVYVSAIDVLTPKDFDTVAGTHIFLDGNFSYNNLQVGCTAGGATDGESYMFDTLDQQAYSQQIVFRNNYGVKSQRYNLQFFYQQRTASVPHIKVYNNTMFACCGSLTQFGSPANTAFVVSEINMQNGSTGGTTLPWIMTVQNNIFRTNWATPGNDGSVSCGGAAGCVVPVNAGADSGSGGLQTFPLTLGGTGNENVMFGLSTICPQTCLPASPNFSINQDDSLTFGANFLQTDPLFNNTSDLLSNRVGVPNCTGFTNVVACMGWNFRTQTATNPSFVYDLIPTCSQCAGKGVQLPKASCGSPDPDYPVWLKGVNYLTASCWCVGAVITEHVGLSNKPCGM
jgi:hypothetical protein